MKNIFAIFCVIFIISCNPKKEKMVIQEADPANQLNTFTKEDSSTETAEDIAFEKELEEVAIDGKNLQIETTDSGKIEMSFDIETLKHMTNEIKKQRYEMENTYTYDSEQDKKNAIEAINLSLEMFQGKFCCTTHNGKHCEDSNRLQKLKDTYDCERFKKKS
ncbi:hypothetical protein [uncultured Kordia sp.]|uniref:hypothetical protein n=1 Tax=uncultured Kordia sp. TaxID=507699 RepID=UPI00260BF45E|nr:hypothetical protein [uncultured Kordia sp.]